MLLHDNIGSEVKSTLSSVLLIEVVESVVASDVEGVSACSVHENGVSNMFQSKLEGGLSVHLSQLLRAGRGSQGLSTSSIEPVEDKLSDSNVFLSELSKVRVLENAESVSSISISNARTVSIGNDSVDRDGEGVLTSVDDHIGRPYSNSSLHEW